MSEIEGNVVMEEKFASRIKERIYVAQSGGLKRIVVVEPKKRFNIICWLIRLFLPQDYPQSVSKDYMPYQVWDTAQAFCSTITGILATQEVLRGFGVGDTSATPLAATIIWVIKDGCGHIGKILFAYYHGTSLDAYSKKWRLYADILNDAAMCIEIALPMFSNYTTIALCISTVMKAVVGVAGGATRAAMTQHHAIRGNMADVSAKDSAQETAVNLIASFAALLIVTFFGTSLRLFALFMILHIMFNFFAVKAVCLRTLNEPRFMQVINIYLKDDMLAHPCEINRSEPILGSDTLDFKLCGFRIKLGCSLKKVIHLDSRAIPLAEILSIYENRSYVLYPNTRDMEMYILLKYETTVEDILCAYFHAVVLSIVTCAINNKKLAVYSQKNTDDDNVRLIVEMCHKYQEAHWSRMLRNPNGQSSFRYDPTYKLLSYIDKIVKRVWPRLQRGLTKTGWDLEKHLLIVDEWRLRSSTKQTRTVTDLVRHQSKLAVIPYCDLSSIEVESDSSASKKYI